MISEPAVNFPTIKEEDKIAEALSVCLKKKKTIHLVNNDFVEIHTPFFHIQNGLKWGCASLILALISALLAFAIWLILFANARNRVARFDLEEKLERIFMLRKIAAFFVILAGSLGVDILIILRYLLEILIKKLRWQKKEPKEQCKTSNTVTEKKWMRIKIRQILVVLLLSISASLVSHFCLYKLLVEPRDFGSIKEKTHLELDFRQIVKYKKQAGRVLILSGSFLRTFFLFSFVEDAQLLVQAFLFPPRPQQGIMTIYLLSRNLQVFLYWATVASFGLFSTASLAKFHYTSCIPYLTHIHWNFARDSYQQNNYETYYQRPCTPEDVSTTSIMNTIIAPEATSSEIANTILEHGAAIIPNVIDRETASKFRDFTLFRNSKLRPNEKVFVMKSENQTRWAFAIKPQDDPVVADVLEQVYKNNRFRSTLEEFLGPDPALIKMQTITSRAGAESQGYHPDTISEASMKTFIRSFLPHFSVFIYLQDTTKEMGATWICPGTQFCDKINKNVKNKCKPITSDYNHHQNTRFMRAGNAVIMNQNTFHRGGQYTLRDGPHRSIIVMTFTARHRRRNKTKTEQKRPIPSGSWSTEADMRIAQEARITGTEIRRLSMGTPLSSFGFTLNDFSNPKKYMSNLMVILRFWGVWKYPESNWSQDYVTSIWDRVASEGDKFKRRDLESYIIFLIKLGFPTNLILKYFVLNEVPAKQKDRGTWDVWFELSLRKMSDNLQKVTMFLLALLISSMLLMCIFKKLISRKKNHTSSDESQFPKKKPIEQTNAKISCSDLKIKNNLHQNEDIFFLIRRSVSAPALIVLTLVVLHILIERSTTIQDIKSGQTMRHPFPDNSTRVIHSLSIPNLLSSNLYSSMVEVDVPTRNDILIGTRFGSLHLRGFNRFLDYHTGNKAWRKEIAFAVETYGNYIVNMPESLRSLVVTTILTNLRRLCSPRKTCPGKRFMIQQIHNGKWQVLAESEAHKYTRRALLCTSNLIIGGLEESIAYMLSEMRYESVLRGTAMALLLVGYLEDFRSIYFFRENMPKNDRRNFERIINRVTAKDNASVYVSHSFVDTMEFPNKNRLKIIRAEKILPTSGHRKR